MAYNFRLSELSNDFFVKKGDTDRIVLPCNLGDINTSKEIISEDILLAKQAVRSNGEFSLATESIADKPEMFICIALKGSFYRHNCITNREENNCQGTLLVEYNSRTQKLFKVGKGTVAEGIVITLDNSFLEQNFFYHLKDKKRREIEENYNDSTFITSSLLNSRTFCLSKDIYNSPFSGALQKMYLQSKVYEIIHNELLSIIDTKDKREAKSKIVLSHDNIDALHRAKAIILENKKSVGISELAKRVALNEKKLKYGFKKLFKTTPGNMMLETKMYEAKRLLEESEHNVNEVSDIIGYKYVQNFTKAFINFFGKKPSDIMKSRSYYY